MVLGEAQPPMGQDSRRQLALSRQHRAATREPMMLEQVQVQVLVQVQVQVQAQVLVQAQRQGQVAAVVQVQVQLAMRRVAGSTEGATIQAPPLLGVEGQRNQQRTQLAARGSGIDAGAVDGRAQVPRPKGVRSLPVMGATLVARASSPHRSVDAVAGVSRGLQVATFSKACRGFVGRTT